MDNKRVLVFPAGAENALEIYDSLRYNVNVEVFGASGKKDFAEYVYDKEHYIERNLYISDDGFDRIFESIIREYRIDVVIPTHDEIALYLAKNRELFSAKILVSSSETAEICRSKRKMYDLICDCCFCPKIYLSPQCIGDSEYPVFIKPDIGAGGVGAYKANSKNEISSNAFSDDYVVCEYLPGKELTVDCFTNRHGSLAFTGARSRDRISMGIAYRSTMEQMSDEVKRIAETLNKRLNFFGAWYFQVRQDKCGKYKLMEVSCRQSGTMTFYRHLGINFPLLGIFELFDVDTSYVLNTFGNLQLERRLHTAFKFDLDYEVLYLDFDDTLIVDNEVCDVIIRLVYQALNEGKKIVLLSRHEKESIMDALERYRISPNIFERIYQLTFDESKIYYINPENAIFIDNSFAERKEVNNRYGIPVFDVDMVDMLIRE